MQLNTIDSYRLRDGTIVKLEAVTWRDGTPAFKSIHPNPDYADWWYIATNFNSIGEFCLFQNSGPDPCDIVEQIPQQSPQVRQRVLKMRQPDQERYNVLLTTASAATLEIAQKLQSLAFPEKPFHLNFPPAPIYLFIAANAEQSGITITISAPATEPTP